MPPSRQFEQAGTVAVRAGEAAAHVAKQFGFEQRVGDAGGVEGDERAAAACAEGVNRASREFFADAAFTGDQHFGVRSRGVS